MPNLSSINFEKSLKIYEFILNGILFVNLIFFALFAIEFTFELARSFSIISFVLYLFISYIISDKFQDSWLKDNFKSIKS